MTPEAPTGLLLHRASSLHDTGWRHPEHQGRLRALARAVERDMPALHGRVTQMEPDLAGEDDILRVHEPALVGRVREAVERARKTGQGVHLDSDTVVSGASLDAALGSSGAAIEAVEQVASGALANAFVASRPPGHHATPTRAMGFCLFNHVAVAARWLQARGHGDRVLIIDWDVHHGNGTQDAFYDEGSVFYVSLHQSPHYPGTGAASEMGIGAGEGATLNVPLPAGTPREAYLDRFDQALDRALEDFTPDFVLVSCGFDVLAGDPLGGQLLEPGDLHRITRRIVTAAEDACGGRVVALLEGGYVPERLGTGVVSVIRALAGVADPAG